ncbi:IS256 family transposase, partial [Enterococcus avium]
MNSLINKFRQKYKDSYLLRTVQTVDKVHFMDDVYSLFFYNRFMKTNARSDSYD